MPAARVRGPFNGCIQRSASGYASQRAESSAFAVSPGYRMPVMFVAGKMETSFSGGVAIVCVGPNSTAIADAASVQLEV